MPSRRESLVLGGSTLAVLVSGCQTVLNVGRSPIDLQFYNYTDRTQPLKLELLRTGNRTHGAAAVVDREFEVPPPSGDEPTGTVRKPDIAERRAYVVRVLLKYGDGTWAHHHFYPDDSSHNQVDIRIYPREQTDDLYVRFR